MSRITSNEKVFYKGNKGERFYSNGPFTFKLTTFRLVKDLLVE